MDNLAAASVPIDTEDHIKVIPNGLRDNNDGFITLIMSQSKPYVVGKIEALLMA